MYICEICGAKFDRPLNLNYSENLDGENGIEARSEVVCPFCNVPHFHEMTEEETHADI